jgi:aminoglycoside phosphotransferase (APT) family kinase protein
VNPISAPAAEPVACGDKNAKAELVLLRKVKAYVNQRQRAAALGLRLPVRVNYLANGEYNRNYLLDDGQRRLVLRANTKSQIGLGKQQIVYEYRTLRLLADSRVTPRAFWLDNSRTELPLGLLVMEYLPGRPLNYRSDLDAAATTLAHIHAQDFAAEDTNYLISETRPLSAILAESQALLATYLASPLASNATQRLMCGWLEQAHERVSDERFLAADPWLRVVNTDVHNENFIVNPAAGSCHLIDWEKPNLAEPAKDLCHFLQITSTRFKDDFVISPQQRRRFIRRYLAELGPCPQAASLEQRMHIFSFFTLLRAVAWCCQAWLEYTTAASDKLRDNLTFAVIQSFIDPDFIRNLLKDY